MSACFLGMNSSELGDTGRLRVYPFLCSRRRCPAFLACSSCARVITARSLSEAALCFSAKRSFCFASGIIVVSACRSAPSRIRSASSSCCLRWRSSAALAFSVFALSKTSSSRSFLTRHSFLSLSQESSIVSAVLLSLMRVRSFYVLSHACFRRACSLLNFSSCSCSTRTLNFAYAAAAFLFLSTIFASFCAFSRC